MRALTTCLALALPTMASAEAPVERRLHASSVEASSFLWNAWNKFQENYHPLYLADDDPKTAWVEGVEGDGAGEWVRVHVTPMAGATAARLHVRNGYQKSAGLYKANARPKSVTVKLLPGGTTKTLTLADAQGWQDLNVEQPAGPLSGVELKVESVYPGKKYKDTCISDVQVFVTAMTRENPAVEKARLARTLKWKAERAAAAKVFAQQDGATLPIAAQYQEKESTEAGRGWKECDYGEDPLCQLRQSLPELEATETGDLKAALGRAAALAKDGFAALKPVRVTAQDTRKLPAVDGLCARGVGDGEEATCYEGLDLPGPNQAGYLDANQLAVFEAANGTTIKKAIAAQAPGCNTETGATHAWATMAPAAAGAPSHVEALMLVRCQLVSMREGTEPVAQAQLLVYAPDGRLQVVASQFAVSTLTWRPDGKVLAGGARHTGTGEHTAYVEFVPVAAR